MLALTHLHENHCHSATYWGQEVTPQCFLQCPKGVRIQQLLYQSTSGDEAADARTPSIAGAAFAGTPSCRRPELRGGARARSTLLAALIY